MNFSSKASSLQEPSCLKISHADPDIYSAITHRLLFHFSRTRTDTPIVIVCVGTDRSTGDSLGPLVGTALARFHSSLFHLYGTLDDPVHAVNLEETLSLIYQKHPNPFIIGIDACLGQSTSVGCIQVVDGPPAGSRGQQAAPSSRRYPFDWHCECRRLHGVFCTAEYEIKPCNEIIRYHCFQPILRT